MFCILELEFLKILVRSGGNPEDRNQLPIVTELAARVLSQFNDPLKIQIAFDEHVDALEKNRE